MSESREVFLDRETARNLDPSVELSPAAEALYARRDNLAAGKFGDVKSPAVQNRLARVNAEIEYEVQQGRAPRERAWTVERVAEDRFTSQYGTTRPNPELPEQHQKFIASQLLEGKANLMNYPEQLAKAQADARENLTFKITERTRFWSELNGVPRAQMVATMVADAKTVVDAMATKEGWTGKQRETFDALLMTDPDILTNLATRGRQVRVYDEQRKAHGLATAAPPGDPNDPFVKLRKILGL